MDNHPSSPAGAAIEQIESRGAFGKIRIDFMHAGETLAFIELPRSSARKWAVHNSVGRVDVVKSKTIAIARALEIAQGSMEARS